MGLYLEDIDVGKTYHSVDSRTITAGDVDAYAALLGDHNPLHMDGEQAARSPLGRRTAHGMLAAGLLVAMAMETMVSGTAVKLLDVQMTFLAPVDLGDTLRGEFVPRSTLPSLGNPARGTLDLQCRLLNQKDTAVAEGVLNILLRTRAGAQG